MKEFLSNMFKNKIDINDIKDGLTIERMLSASVFSKDEEAKAGIKSIFWTDFRRKFCINPACNGFRSMMFSPTFLQITFKNNGSMIIDDKQDEPTNNINILTITTDVMRLNRIEDMNLVFPYKEPDK